ncbi:serine/threonine-protein kinase [Streptomyces sp. NPDC090303]|uniref:serine/threonine-protein kinase n=1 Tax=Streptomyces sp. NPDC090303 TaxID=3365960 RepID=UPI0038043CC2
MLELARLRGNPAFAYLLERRMRDDSIGISDEGRFVRTDAYPIGVGASAYVWKVYDCVDGRDVALKVLKAPASVTLRKRFSQEVDLLKRRMRSRYIVPVLAHGSCARFDGEYWYAMPLYSGSLYDRYSEIELCQESMFRLIKQMCSALDHAHAHGVIHRDVNPGNIFEVQSGWWVLGDFGMALDVHQKQCDGSVVNGKVGTQFYVSPEQAYDSSSVDVRADIYSLSKVLHYLLTGGWPLSSDDVFGRYREVVLKGTSSLGLRYSFIGEMERGLQCAHDAPELVDAYTMRRIGSIVLPRVTSADPDELALRELLRWMRLVSPSDREARQILARIILGLPMESITRCLRLDRCSADTGMDTMREAMRDGQVDHASYASFLNKLNRIPEASYRSFVSEG